MTEPRLYRSLPECPHCGHPDKYAFDDELDEDESREDDCVECGKTYTVTKHVRITFCTRPVGPDVADSDASQPRGQLIVQTPTALGLMQRTHAKYNEGDIVMVLRGEARGVGTVHERKMWGILLTTGQFVDYGDVRLVRPAAASSDAEDPT